MGRGADRGRHPRPPEDPGGQARRRPQPRWRAPQPHALLELHEPSGGGAPSGDLAAAIDAKFGSFDAFKADFKAAGIAQFGSGWAWLVKDADGLKIVSTANQDNPVTNGMAPLLGVDVGEHAYYLNYQNRRPDYLDAWWNVVDWDGVAQRFSA